ncbi:multidrug resistance-associated ABC transporter [Ramaria rubella]|nr:multidrug resistance-associated ABC transporter [Ramaria rubella]
MHICIGDITDPRARELWATLPPIALVALLVLVALPVPLPCLVSKAFAYVRDPFLPKLTLAEAGELERRFAIEDAVRIPQSEEDVAPKADKKTPTRWRTVSFVSLALVETVAWLAVGVLNVIPATRQALIARSLVLLPWTPFLVSLTWVYAFIRALHRPPITAPFDLFTLFSLHLIGGALSLGSQLYISGATDSTLPSGGVLLAESVNLVILSALWILVVTLPLNIPGPLVDLNKIPTPSPEDYTTLAGWMSFHWVRPLIVVGSSKKLNDEDVWDISPTLKTRSTFAIYKQTSGGLMLRLIRANSMDLILDFCLTEVSVLLDFGGPFFLQGILEGLENPQPGSRNTLYLYTFLMLVAGILKAEAEVQHLWYSRRAGARIGAQLSAAVYDKALRITDQGGVVNAAVIGTQAAGSGPKPAGNSKKDADVQGENKDKKEEDTDKEAGADVGKIVNLMGIDIVKCQDTTATIFNLYAAPVQLTISCIYLYGLLGISAFAGFVSLLIAVPMSQLLANWVMRVTKGKLAATDKRMKLLNEMFGSIRFIKFFAWEGQWIKKVTEARKVEMKWLKKNRNASICYSMLWLVVPNMISAASFFVYIYTGHELSVSTAFTAIRLFGMLKRPLGILPYAMVMLAQAKVSVDRLKKFLNEGEVPVDVCGLTRPIITKPEEVKIEHGSFKWVGNGSGKSAEKDADKSKASSAPATVPQASENARPEDDVNATASISTRTAVNCEGESEFELKDINLTLAPGKLTVVTGPTASGKTALLMALLGEMDKVDGKVTIPKNPSIVNEHGLRNSISYCAQTPWLQQQSIKDNIVFEHPLDEERYNAVIEACALGPDFQALEDGDLTEIGSKGVSLSGGQKARVALARAVYAPTQYLILDDIFSAVDSHTARFLFEHLLKGPLVSHRTVLLVTHHVELVLPGTHYLIQLLEGRIHQQGTVEELKGQGLLNYIMHEAHTKDNEGLPKEVDSEDKVKTGITGADGVAKQARKLVEEEERADGEVKWSIYKIYLKASSYWTWFFALLGIVAAELCEVGVRVWMGIWGSAYNVAPESLLMTSFSRVIGSHVHVFGDAWPAQYRLMLSNETVNTDMTTIAFPDAHVHPFFYVGVYCAIGLVAAIVSVIAEWILFTGGLRSGLVLFERLIISLSGATFRFFDITPTGRILNRFGKDFDLVDSMLPMMMHNLTAFIAAFFGAAVTVIIVVPGFLPIAAIITFIYVRLSLGYLATGRDLRRMESNSRSPILAGFSDLVGGIVTVRAFSLERQFLAGHYKRVDTSQRFWYFTWMINRWLLLNFDILGAVSVFAATVFVLAGYVPVGYAALSIVSAMTFSTSIYWCCRGYTEVELCLNSVERIVEYLQIPKEPPAVIEGCQVPAYWPSGTDSDSLLVVEDLEVKYAPDLPSVLQDISFSLKAQERVGLLGRTGCGKSTLAMSLLRFVEPSKGKIIIDGIDITSIGTQDLRSRVTFIPQDATLFAGTIRDNLDPFNEHSDEECVDALARVDLISHGSQRPSRVPSRAPSIHSGREDISSPVESETVTQSDAENKIPIKLDTSVSPGGQNFSNGQRQLLAMARALLRQSAVVILDEATSSIDKAADVKIQSTIRQEFNRSLLLTVAHRLGTIIDFDRLIVLDKGRIAEFDTPYNLIRKEGGIFREMCIQSGTFSELQAAARAQAEQP